MKLSQAALAEMVVTSQSAIGDYETGRSQPSLEMFSRLASALNTSSSWLAFEDGPQKINYNPRDIDILLPGFFARAKEDPLFAHILYEFEKVCIELEFLHHDLEFQLLVAARINKAIHAETPKGVTHMSGDAAIAEVAARIAQERNEIRRGLTALRLGRISDIDVL